MGMSGHYNTALVLLSYAIAVFASFTALDLATRVRTTDGKGARAWIIAAAVAMGGGIWAMHFVGMLAWMMPMPVAYDSGVTIASLLLPIVVTGIGLFVVNADSSSTGRILAAGALMGGGIVSMHYLGMSGMRMQARLDYDPVLVKVSVLIAIGASVAALRLAFRTGSGLQRFAAAGVMGLAVVGMHYTGMAAATFVVDADLPGPSGDGLDQTVVGTLVTVVSVSLLSMALFSAMVDRRLAQREAGMLRASELRFRALVQNASDAMVLIDNAGAIGFASGPVDRILGRPETALLGWPAAEIVQGDGGNVAELVSDAVSRPGESVSRTVRTELPEGGYRTLEVIATNLLHQPAVAGIVMTFRDLTERLRLEEELDQTSRLATLGTMAAGIAHEMSQPLNAISLWSEDALLAMEEGEFDRDHLKQVMKVAVEQTQRLRGIVDHMRVFSRRDTGTTDVFDVRDSLRVSVQLIERQFAAEGVTVVLDLPEDPVQARGRPLQLEQVVLNLLTNARDAVQDRVAIAPDRDGRIDVTVRADAAAGTLAICVSDTGTGIKPRDMARIFDPFFTVKEAGRGTGLGLAISFRIVEAMGGRITAANVVEGGTVTGARFEVRLPLVK